MNFQKHSTAILEELQAILSRVSEEDVLAFQDAVLSVPRVFVSGAGRSLLMARCFAMRLMQTGLQVHVVGDTVTPSIQPGDLLVIASGSGETGTLKVVASGAKKAGAKIAVITGNPDSSLARQADVVVTIPASTPKLHSNEGRVASVQPGASAFEQCVLLLCDTVVAGWGSGENLSERNSQLMKLHANLE